MTFYGHGIVWGNGKRLCKFVDGKYSTDEIAVCRQLSSRGYKNDGNWPEVTVIAAEVVPVEEEQVVPEEEPVKEQSPRKTRGPRRKQ